MQKVSLADGLALCVSFVADEKEEPLFEYHFAISKVFHAQRWLYQLGIFLFLGLFVERPFHVFHFQVDLFFDILFHFKEFFADERFMWSPMAFYTDSFLAVLTNEYSWVLIDVDSIESCTWLLLTIGIDVWMYCGIFLKQKLAILPYSRSIILYDLSDEGEAKFLLAFLIITLDFVWLLTVMFADCYFDQW